MVTTVTDNSPQSINTSLFAMDSEIQKVKKIAESFDEKLSGIDIETGVLSVNGKQGIVELTASDVDALPSSTVIPTTTSELENTSGFITESSDITGNAATATKAEQDAKGNVITDTYATKTELDNKSGIGHTHSADDITSGTLPIARGGTGASNGQDAFDNIVSGVRTSSNPVDAETMLFRNSSWYKTTVLNFWEYIKGKISSVLGLTASNYKGNAATATKADKVKNALTVNGKTYDGSAAIDAGVQTIANGGTGQTTQADINKAFVGGLEEGESDVTDGTEFVSSYASNNGFADTNAVNVPYKRKFSRVWEYIKSKIASVLGLTASNYGGTAATILDYAKNTPIKVRWGGPGIDSAEWYPAFNADGSAIEPIYRDNIRAGKVSSSGTSGLWIKGRDNAICRTTTAAEGGGWKTLASIKTASGSIEIGNLSGEDFVRIVYSSDTDVNEGNNNLTHLLYIRRGNIETPHEFIAYSVKALGKMVIPIGAPYSLEDGCIWIQ